MASLNPAKKINGKTLAEMVSAPKAQTVAMAA